MTEAEKPVKTDHETVTNQPAPFWHSSNKLLIGLLGFILFVLVFMAGAWFSHTTDYRTNRFFVGNPKGGFGRSFNHRGFGQQIPNGQSRVNGVVTQVNGNNFTLASHGTTATVTTTSTTQYTNGNQVKVNDSVIVSGTTSGSTITASSVVINP